MWFFAFVCGVVPVLIVFLEHRSLAHHPLYLAGFLVTSMVMGALWGFLVWKGRQALGSKLMTRPAIRMQTVLFIGLMLGLSYAMWILTRH